MNDLQQLVQEIGRRLDSNDLTNTEVLRGLAEDYVRSCNAFNKKVEECRQLLERRMYVEAGQLADQAVPPLGTQE